VVDLCTGMGTGAEKRLKVSEKEKLRIKYYNNWRKKEDSKVKMNTIPLGENWGLPCVFWEGSC